MIRELIIGGAVVASAVVGVVSARAQHHAAPPPAVDSPNVCVLNVGSRSWCGDDGPAEHAKLAGPSDVALVGDGSILIADTLNNVIRRVRADGTIVSIAGTGRDAAAVARSDADVVAFSGPQGVDSTSDGGVLVADTGNDAVRLISAGGSVTTLAAPSGTPSKTTVALKAPSDVVGLPGGAYLIADTGNNRVLRVSATGVSSVVAGTPQAGYAGDGGPAVAARLRGPTQVFATNDGTMLIADTGNGAVRRVLPSGLIETVAHGLRHPRGVVGRPDGTVLVTSAAGIFRVDADGTPERVAGMPQTGFNGDLGPALRTQFDGLGQLVLRPDGRLLVAEQGSDRIRNVSQTGVVTTLAGSGAPISPVSVGIPAGAIPRELAAGPAAPSAAQASETLAAQSATTSKCEDYNPLFVQFSFMPPDAEPLKAPVRVQDKRKTIKLRFAASRKAKIVLMIESDGQTIARVSKTVRATPTGATIVIAGAFATKHKYLAKLFGAPLPLPSHVVRCDVSHIRVL